jgi:signal peptidase I
MMILIIYIKVSRIIAMSKISLIFVWLINILYNTYYNMSNSAPIGLYLLVAHKHLGYKDRVMIDDLSAIHVTKMHELGLPDDGGHMLSIIKVIVGIPGDTVDITNSGIYINKLLQPNSVGIQLYNHITLNPLRYKSFVLAKDEYFVLGDSVHSYDSRYIGPIHTIQIKGKLLGPFLHNFWSDNIC